MTLLIAAIRELHRDKMASKFSKVKCMEKEYMDLVNKQELNRKMLCLPLFYNREVAACLNRCR